VGGQNLDPVDDVIVGDPRVVGMDADGRVKSGVFLDQRDGPRIAFEAGARADTDDVGEAGCARPLEERLDVGEVFAVEMGMAVHEPHLGCLSNRRDARLCFPAMVPWVALLAAQPVVAVFEIEDATAKKKSDRDTIHHLTEYLGGQIGEGGRFRVVPSADLAKLLLEQKKESFRDCFDEACQIEIGKAVAAEKSLSTQIMHLGSSCIMKSVLFDLAKEVSEQVATVKGGCSTDELIATVEKVAFKLKSETPPLQVVNDKKGSGLCSPAESCYQIGLDHRDGKNGRARDLELAQRHLLEGCTLGHGASCTDLGYLFEKGKLIPEDHARAAELYHRGCELGNATGCTNTGFMYEKGKGVKEDAKLSVQYYEKGCDMGNARGCTNLGFMYRNGYGVKQDDARALELYEKGCDGGNAGGCTNLGYLFETGQGVRKDLDRAVSLYRKGCDGGSSAGCSNLGYMYEHGRGVGRDRTIAIKYYRRGCEAGNARGCESLQKLR
jgi:TPR repeat protein